MPKLRFLNVLDVARSLGASPIDATPEAVAHWLITEYGGGGRFNYDTANQTLYGLFSGALSPEAAVQYCLTSGNPLGRKSNASAISSISDYAASNPSQCYRIGNTAVVVGRASGLNVYMGIKTPLARVRNDRAFIVMPGFRMAYRPSEAQLDFVCSAILGTFARDELAVADIEYLYAGPAEFGRGRSFRPIHGQDRRILSIDVVDDVLDIYVKGVALALREGGDAREPRFSGYSLLDPDEPGLFR